MIEKPMRLIGSLVLLAFLVTFAQTAKADTIQYTLTADHCTGTCLSTPSGGTVELSQVANNQVQVSVDLVPYLQFMTSGLQYTIDFNLIGTPDVTYSEISTDSVNGFTFMGLGDYHMDGFGYFEYSLDSNVAKDGNYLTFYVTCPSCDPGTLTPASFATFGNANNGDGTNAYFAVDVFSNDGIPGGNGNTGPIGAQEPGTPVPEQGTVVLLGLGLIALAGLAAIRGRYLSADSQR